MTSLFFNVLSRFVIALFPRNSSVQFSHSVVSDSLRPHESQHARPPCPSPTPGVHPNSWPSSQWCHPTILSSVVPFSFCLQSFSASGSFQMSQFFASGGQRIGVLALASVLPVNTQDWSPLGRTGWISCTSLAGTGTNKGKNHLSMLSSEILSPLLLSSHHLSFAIWMDTIGKKAVICVFSHPETGYQSVLSIPTPRGFLPSHPLCSFSPCLPGHSRLLLVAEIGRAVSQREGFTHTLPSAWSAFPASSPC